jgi:hypothetical protein
MRALKAIKGEPDLYVETDVSSDSEDDKYDNLYG